MTRARQELGADGEDLACRALVARGYRILARRFRTRLGEVDVVAEVDGTLVFVEVKTRRDRQFGHPAEAVTAQKQRRLAAMASLYVARHRRERAPVRFDVVAIVQDGCRSPQIEVIADAFRPGW